jgi:hypothetical protein
MPFFHVCRAVQGHHDHPYGREWINITDHVNPLLAELLGREKKLHSTPGVLVLGLTFSPRIGQKVHARLRSLVWAL